METAVPDEPISAQTKLSVCKTCTMLICEKCVTLSDHGGHTLIDLHDSSAEKAVSRQSVGTKELADSNLLKELGAAVKLQAKDNEKLHNRLVEQIQNTGMLLKLEVDKQTELRLKKCKQFGTLNREKLAEYETELLSLNETHCRTVEERGDVIDIDTEADKTVDLPVVPKLILVEYRQPVEMEALVSRALGDLSIQENVRGECESCDTQF
ncbi:uncharacterized protein LOC117343934 [Pecten maximus]|uniref:uncharacterized protein LOC117343934 n=1 Tax=Pecten maximus TaxID=6579 RepID=UPI00145907E7|nr:uncharacterized protein LOC117343934 [Pecten maximus]